MVRRIHLELHTGVLCHRVQANPAPIEMRASLRSDPEGLAPHARLQALPTPIVPQPVFQFLESLYPDGLQAFDFGGLGWGIYNGQNRDFLFELGQIESLLRIEDRHVTSIEC